MTAKSINIGIKGRWFFTRKRSGRKEGPRKECGEECINKYWRRIFLFQPKYA
jgi:hypothetical protein